MTEIHRQTYINPYPPQDDEEDVCAEGETEEEAESSQPYEEVDDSSDHKRRAPTAMSEDMAKLENMFQEKGMHYRLIDRIGEG